MAAFVKSVGDVADGGTIPSPRAASLSVLIGENTMLVFGGLGLTTYFNDIHALDTRTFTWGEWKCNGIPPSARGSGTGGLLALRSDDAERGTHGGGGTITISASGGVPMLIVFGGRDGRNNTLLNDTHCLDINRRRWHLVEPTGDRVPSPREDSLSVSVDAERKLLVYGGARDDGAVLDDMWLFDLEASLWTPVEYSGVYPPQGLAAAMCTKLDDYHAVVFGGYDGSSYLNKVYLLELGNLHWTRVEVETTIPRPRTHAAFHCVSSFVPMGRSSEAAENGWTDTGKASRRAIAVLFGGYCGANALHDVWIFQIDFSSFTSALETVGGSWLSVGPPLPSGSRSSLQTISSRGASTSVFVPQDGCIYVYGGCNGSQFLSSVTAMQLDLSILLPQIDFQQQRVADRSPPSSRYGDYQQVVPAARSAGASPIPSVHRVSRSPVRQTGDDDGDDDELTRAVQQLRATAFPSPQAESVGAGGSPDVGGNNGNSVKFSVRAFKTVAEENERLKKANEILREEVTWLREELSRCSSSNNPSTTTGMATEQDTSTRSRSATTTTEWEEHHHQRQRGLRRKTWL